MMLAGYLRGFGVAAGAGSFGVLGRQRVGFLALRTDQDFVPQLVGLFQRRGH